MFLSTRYLPAIKALKDGDAVVVRNTVQAHQMASRLIAIGVATPRVVDYGDFKSLLLCPIVEPEPDVQPEPDTVQVSFWQSGARAGMFSQKAYPVLDRTKTLVKVELMPGMPKWYPVAQVKAA